MNSKHPLTPEEIAFLLAQLQKTSKRYPPKLMAARRSSFLQQAESLKIGTGGLSRRALRNIPKNVQTGVTSTMGVATQWFIGVMAAVLFTAVAIIAVDALMAPITPNDGVAVSSETALPSFASTPSPVSANLISTNLTPTRRIGPPYRKTPAATKTLVSGELNPTEHGNSGKHLGQTPTPPAFRDTPKPYNPTNTPKPVNPTNTPKPDNPTKTSKP